MELLKLWAWNLFKMNISWSIQNFINPSNLSRKFEPKIDLEKISQNSKIIQKSFNNLNSPSTFNQNQHKTDIKSAKISTLDDNLMQSSK